MFRNLLAKNKSQFLVLPELNFQDEIEFKAILESHNVSEKTALKFDSYRELIYENNVLVKAFDYEDGKKFKRTLLTNEKGLPYCECTENKFLSIIPADDGINQLGGKLPSDIIFENGSNVQFQYLGFVSHKNREIEFLNHDLHLIAPVYSDFTKIYLDYSVDKLIKTVDVEANLEEVENLYDELDENHKIVYEIFKFNIQENNELGNVGHSGVPLWVQYPEIPKCPKTGKNMKFLLQMNSGSNIIESPDNFPEEKLTFSSGNGNLYVFFSPESDIACFIIQES